MFRALRGKEGTVSWSLQYPAPGPRSVWESFELLNCPVGLLLCNSEKLPCRVASVQLCDCISDVRSKNLQGDVGEEIFQVIEAKRETRKISSSRSGSSIEFMGKLGNFSRVVNSKAATQIFSSKGSEAAGEAE